jgi:hypothetical protein
MFFKQKQQKFERYLLILVVISLVILVSFGLFFVIKVISIINEASFFEKPKESNLHFKILEAEKILFQER